MSVRSRLARLEQRAEERQRGRPRREDREADKRRWEATLTHFVEVLPDDLWDRVSVALQDDRCLLWPWLRDICRGRSRLPECLTEDVMRRLVLIWLDEADQCEPWEAVCLRCGLQYPRHKRPPLGEWKLAPGCSPDERPLRYNLPHFFDHDGCPACDASSKVEEMNWAHLMEDGYWTTGKHDGSEGRGTGEAAAKDGGEAKGDTG